MTPTASARCKIGVNVDLSDYIRPDDAVILLQVSPTSILFGANWGSIDLSISPSLNPIQGPKTKK